MNWDAIGAVGEIIGALAVVCSLAYLALQIRNQNKEAQAAAVHQVIEGYRSSIRALQEPDMAEVWILGIDDFEQLDRAQKLRFNIYLTVTLRSFENAFYQWKQGKLEDDIWDALLQPLIGVKSTHAFSFFWRDRRHHFRKGFADYVDELKQGDYSYV